MYRKSFGILAEKYAGPFGGIVFASVQGFCKDVLPDSPKIAEINFDLTIELFLCCPLFLVDVFLDFLRIAVAETLLISSNYWSHGPHWYVEHTACSTTLF